jgi:hypothetical protein
VDEAAQRSAAEGPLIATFVQDPGGAFPAVGDDLTPNGPLMTLKDWAALAQAPQRSAGTQVSVKASKVRPLGDIPDHMFVEYDDGQNPLIARGGPSKSGADFLPGWLDGSNRVTARVDASRLSPDYGTDYRTLATTYLPGVSAEQAAAAARQHAEGVNRGGNAYGLHANSNSFAADIAEPILGFRPSDPWTPGYRTHLSDGPPMPPGPEAMFRPNPLAPILRDPL